jgi:hypothetical protein
METDAACVAGLIIASDRYRRNLDCGIWIEEYGGFSDKLQAPCLRPVRSGPWSGEGVAPGEDLAALAGVLRSGWRVTCDLCMMVKHHDRGYDELRRVILGLADAGGYARTSRCGDQPCRRSANPSGQRRQ